MAGKQSTKVIVTEELMEMESICSNLLDDMQPIDNSLLENEAGDHLNDKYRNEGMVFLRKAIESLQNGQTADVSKYLHAAFQKFQDQALIDHKDDIPRDKARLLFERYKGKLMLSQEKVKNLIVRIQMKMGKA